MKHYYYSNNNQQLGPFTFDELKTKRLKKSTLVWADGLKDWITADKLDELKDILISEPPPLPKANPIELKETVIIKNNTSFFTSQYDHTYEKETDATFAGIVLLVIPIALKLSNAFTFDSEYDYNLAKFWFSMISIAVRSWVTYIVMQIAKSQNRSAKGWGWFAFFMPSIALIIIGQLKKLRLRIEIDGTQPLNQQVLILLEKANQFYLDKRYTECIEIVNKVIELDRKNDEAIKIRALSYYEMKNYEQAKTDFDFLNQKETFPSITNYHLGNIEMQNYNRERAVDFWLKANNNIKAQLKLNLYHNYIGKYVLDKVQLNEKVSSYRGIFGIGEYLGGIADIDQHVKIGKFKTDLNRCENGLDIELIQGFKRYHIAIAYYEIKDIILDESKNIFKLSLIDGNEIIFNYDITKDEWNSLKIFCTRYKSATGITPSAEAFFVKSENK